MDIERESWSLNVKVNIMNRLKITGMLGRGLVLDDFDNDNKIDYIYSGGELKAIVSIVPKSLNLGFRYDTYSEEYFENGVVEKQNSYTFGITYKVNSNIQLRLNYKWKILHSKVNPDIDDTPVPTRLLKSTPVVFDIVYNPIQTRLRREAQAAGAQTIGGLDMLVWQGALAFEKWTGLKAPIELMKKEALKALASEN